jgi:hypothetical protein
MNLNMLEETRTEYWVDSATEARKALAAIKRDRPPLAALIISYNRRRSLDNFPTVVAPPGSILIVEVHSGIPHVRVVGGRVVYRAASGWGNVIEVERGQVHVRHRPARLADPDQPQGHCRDQPGRGCAGRAEHSGGRAGSGVPVPDLGPAGRATASGGAGGGADPA